MPCFLAQLFAVSLMYSSGVTTNHTRLASPFNELVERPGNAFRWQGDVDINDETFAAVVIDHVEQVDAAAIGHRPVGHA